MSARGLTVAGDQFDVSLEDSVLLAEVELMADVIVAAAASEGPMSPRDIDEVLGVAVPSPRAGE